MVKIDPEMIICCQGVETEGNQFLGLLTSYIRTPKPDMRLLIRTQQGRVKSEHKAFLLKTLPKIFRKVVFWVFLQHKTLLNQ